MEKTPALAHEAIYSTVEKILREARRGKLLDAPAGHGALAERLIGLGFDVSCCDLYPEIFMLDSVEMRKGNLDGRLPYDDDEFETAVCVEGLEHIENPANAIREFARILAPGGLFIVSVPNIMNIEERLKWLLGGYTSHFKPISKASLAKASSDYPGMEEIALHVNPIGYSEVRFLLEKSGFALEATYIDKQKKNGWAYAPIVAFIRLASKFSSQKRRDERWTNELNSSEVLTGGNTLIFKARKL